MKTKPQETKRPFRMWNDRKKKNEPYRCYGSEKAARKQALALVDQMPVGSTLTIYNNDIGAWLGTFSIKTDGIRFRNKHEDFLVGREA